MTTDRGSFHNGQGWGAMQQEDVQSFQGQHSGEIECGSYLPGSLRMFPTTVLPFLRKGHIILNVYGPNNRRSNNMTQKLIEL